MDIQGFYALVSGTCFTLVGLWWNVVRGKPEWSKNPEAKELATGVNLAFLIPALISMVASLGGDNPFIWRGMFIVSAAFGIYFTTRLAGRTTLMAAHMGLMHRNRWGVSAIYALMLVLAIFPDLGYLVGIQPLQLGGILLALLVLSGHALTWEFLLGAAGDE
jgi:hypothetical protein